MEFITKLHLPKKLSFEEALACKDNGGAFITYQYLVPHSFWGPAHQSSKIYYLKAEEPRNKYAFKYNLMCLLWGWIGIPYGPIYTYSAIRQNKLGMDVTEDVLLNLTESDFNRAVVCIKKVSEIYIVPDKSTLKEFEKSFKKYEQKEGKLSANPYVAEYIETSTPFYTIGIADADFDKVEQIKKYLYQYFFKRVHFEFLSLDVASDLSEKLKSQGKEIDINQA